MFHPKYNFNESVQICIKKLLHSFGMNPDQLTYKSDTPLVFSPDFQKYFNYRHIF